MPFRPSPSCWPPINWASVPLEGLRQLSMPVEFTSSTSHPTKPWLRWISEMPSTASVETGFWELWKNTSLVCYHSHIYHTALHRSSCGMILKYCQRKAFSKVTLWVPCCIAVYPQARIRSVIWIQYLLPWWWHNWRESQRPPGWPTPDWGPRESLRAIPKCR